MVFDGEVLEWDCAALESVLAQIHYRIQLEVRKLPLLPPEVQKVKPMKSVRRIPSVAAPVEVDACSLAPAAGTRLPAALGH